MNKLYIVLLIVLYCTKCFAGIIFEDNFDSLADWTANTTGTDQTYYLADGDQANLPPTSYPGRAYITAIGIHRGGVPKTTVERQITSTAARGSGKGMLYRIEADGQWRGGRWVYGFDVSYSEIYVRFYAKYTTGFDFGGVVGHGYQKLLEVSCWPEYFERTSANSYLGRGTIYWNQPNAISDMYNNASFPPAHFKMFERGANPVYTTLAETSVTALETPLDGEWHCYEIRFKLNSQPGTADGEWEVWLDGTSEGSSSTVNWVDAVAWVTATAYSTTPADVVIPTTSMKGFLPVVSHTSGGAEPVWSNATSIGDTVSDGNGNSWRLISNYGFNRVNIGDNHLFEAFDDTNEIEQDIYFDDIVVSTEYVGTSYTIGSTQAKTRGCSITGGSLK